jgi:hypothetical protein
LPPVDGRHRRWPPRGQRDDVVAANAEIGAQQADVAVAVLAQHACHWMPNSAALSALTSAIRLSTYTWARRWSSLSITARSWRYCGSGAVMMSELVAGSAWICPPVDGWLPPASMVGPLAAGCPPRRCGQRGLAHRAGRPAPAAAAVLAVAARRRAG